MWIFRAILLITLALETGGMAHAEAVPPLGAYREASRLVLESRYAEAEHFLDDFIAGNPHEPLGYLFKAAVLQYAATDYEDGSREREFLALLDRAESLAETRLREDADNLWARYCRYSADCFRGSWLVSRGSVLRGVMKSRSGAAGFARILGAHPEFYDAMLGSGSYRFWKSTAEIPFIGDERAGGIADVRTAIERGRLTGPIANTVLLEMLLVYDSRAAMALGEQMTRRYPGCRLFAWQLGEAYKKLGNYDAAERVFSALAAKYAVDARDDGSGRIRCWWKMAVLARSLGKTDACRAYCEKIVRLGAAKPLALRQTERIRGAERMLTEISR